MKHTIKLITALSAIMLGVLLVVPSCKKDNSTSTPAYQKDWVITGQVQKYVFTHRYSEV